MSDLQLTHIDEKNQPGMVDITHKSSTYREATASCVVALGKDILQLLKDGEIDSKKGPVFQTAIIAGTMAAKSTSQLIPFCHPLPLEKCKFTIEVIDLENVEILCTCKTSAKTGVEMEALTGANIAALTIYDMCKAVSKSITILETKLTHKSGGKSDYNNA